MITQEPIDGRGGLAAGGYAAGVPGMLQRYLNGAVDTLLGGASEVREISRIPYAKKRWCLRIRSPGACLRIHSHCSLAARQR